MKVFRESRSISSSLLLHLMRKSLLPYFRHFPYFSCSPSIFWQFFRRNKALELSGTSSEHKYKTKKKKREATKTIDKTVHQKERPIRYLRFFRFLQELGDEDFDFYDAKIWRFQQVAYPEKSISCRHTHSPRGAH